CKLDFLSKFYSKYTKDPETFTAHHDIAGCIHDMVAGSDTTAITFCLPTFARLRAEVDQVRGNVVVFKESQEWPYLQAVMKETPRIHPATGLPLERVVPKGGATICNRFPPLLFPFWVEHRNPQIWGDDADEFKPERWLIDNSESLAYMNRHWMPLRALSLSP
ncbi:hypothetical protein N7474_006404, partial [Penicillium riverlandense]|uniref:uncharacterized protein n=1 Tax=Penicillium riverlandense TaxID=1903569 RepID=UPI0025491903